MVDIRAAALHGAGIWPHGRDPLTLTADELDDAIVELSCAVGALQHAAARQVPPSDHFAGVAAAIRTLAAFVPDRQEPLMLGKLIDTALKAPGDLAKAATETAVRLPAVPLDVAERAIDGAERGIDRLVDPRARP